MIPSLLPGKITSRILGYNCIRDHVGCSSAGVFRYDRSGDTLYLKITKVSDEIRRERDLLIWLRDKLPVPEVVHYEEQDGYAFLLMTKVDGFMACDCPRDTAGEQDKVHEPIEQTVKLLADALLMVQAVDISNCPHENMLDIKLKSALYNIEHDLVDMDDFEYSNDFETPMDLYRWLVENRPPEELCFTHGDFCLPNIFIDGRKVSGFIDIGRGGIADKWQDIALCVRSLGYNLRHKDNQHKYTDMLFTHLGIQPDEAKIRYYILLDDLF
jgi:aminoglycoside 3'-phosphotransferase-3